MAVHFAALRLSDERRLSALSFAGIGGAKTVPPADRPDPDPFSLKPAAEANPPPAKSAEDGNHVSASGDEPAAKKAKTVIEVSSGVAFCSSQQPHHVSCRAGERRS